MNTEDYVVVTAISSFKMRYVVKIADLQAMNPDATVNPIVWAGDSVTCEELNEFSQEHIGETIIDTFIENKEQILERFDRENSYLSEWIDDQKLEFISRLVDKHK